MIREIPIKTSHDWNDPQPGYLEIDFVVDSGGSMAEEYVHSLVATDVCSGWTEAVPLIAREQSLVVEGLRRIRTRMPMSVLGIDCDNDRAFIIETLASYCREERIALTRSRVHHKSDQAWIEQKNGAVIRRMVGHERLSGIVAGQGFEREKFSRNGPRSAFRIVSIITSFTLFVRVNARSFWPFSTRTWI